MMAADAEDSLLVIDIDNISPDRRREKHFLLENKSCWTFSHPDDAFMEGLMIVRVVSAEVCQSLLFESHHGMIFFYYNWTLFGVGES